jgi:hypothetical protein
MGNTSTKGKRFIAITLAVADTLAKLSSAALSGLKGLPAARLVLFQNSIKHWAILNRLHIGNYYAQNESSMQSCTI